MQNTVCLQAVLLLVVAAVVAQEGEQARDKRSGILLAGGIAPLAAVPAISPILPAAVPAILPGGLAIGRGLPLGHGSIIG
ncbi:hypothetical protein PR048_029728 [Dryococelus australis]|uniref:Uncharacterized protein n=1 Tax=Dryococelus australis TaxID=614101 RepID=A0ABQ9GG38_9NEOP|nr:hypothetical protein PR048_029728 [Dryococelus australis]